MKKVYSTRLCYCWLFTEEM